MAHNLIDADARFVIDPVTHVIRSPSTKTVLIQNDHDSTVITFELARMIDGHDMSLCNMVEVHYINTDYKDKTRSNAGVYRSTDLQVAENANVVTCSWKISQNATQYVGSLNFVVSFRCVDAGGNVTYRWNTATYSKISVSAGIDNGEAVVEEYPDILAQLQEEVDKLAEKAVLHTYQALTDKQKAQARVNIGAAKGGDRQVSFRGIDDSDEEINILAQSLQWENGNLVGGVVSFYADDQRVILRNIKDGEQVDDAATVGQLNAVKDIALQHSDDIRNLQQDIETVITPDIAHLQDAVKDAVHVTEQSLTEEQQAQARDNIGAAALGDLPEWSRQENKPRYAWEDIGTEVEYSSSNTTTISVVFDTPSSKFYFGDEYYQVALSNDLINLNVLQGKESQFFKVVIAGDTYINCVCGTFVSNDKTYIGLGNGKLLGADFGNGEPFLMYYQSTGGPANCHIVGEPNNKYCGSPSTITVREHCEHTYRVPDKYLPLKVVNLTYVEIDEEIRGYIADTEAEVIYNLLRQGTLVFAYFNNQYEIMQDSEMVGFSPIYGWSADDLHFAAICSWDGTYAHYGTKREVNGVMYDFWAYDG